MIIPTAIIPTPTQALVYAYLEVPAISMPAVIPTATDTLTICIIFTTVTIVSSIRPPHTTITNHCQILGTIISVAGKNIGRPILAMNNISWAIVQTFDYLSLNIYAETHPRHSPGRNYHNFDQVQFYSISSEPTIIPMKYTPQIFILSPRVTSQNIANNIPPDPFQPKYKLRIIATNVTKQLIFNLLSRGVSGRYGYSSYLRTMPMQLTRKAVRVVTNTYWRMGMPKKAAMWVCRTRRRGATMARLKLLSRIWGSWLRILQEYSSGRCNAVGGRGVCDKLSSSDSINFQFMVLLLILISQLILAIPTINAPNIYTIHPHPKTHKTQINQTTFIHDNCKSKANDTKIKQSHFFRRGKFSRSILFNFIIIAQAVIEQDKHNDQRTHPCAVQIQLVLHYLLYYYYRLRISIQIDYLYLSESHFKGELPSQTTALKYLQSGAFSGQYF